MTQTWYIHVLPNSRFIKVNKISDDTLEIKLTSQPLKGKANKQLIEVLADYFKTKKSSINIIKGEKSRNKIVQID